MTLLVRNSSNALKAVAYLSVRDAGGLLKAVESAFIRTAAGLKAIWGSFTVSLDRDEVVGAAVSAAPIDITTREVTASADGAVGALTYAWARTAPDGQSWTITDPTSATTAFRTNVFRAAEWNATFECTITDQGGHSASASVSARAYNSYGGEL